MQILAQSVLTLPETLSAANLSTETELVASVLRLRLRTKTPREREVDEACMSFRWYCPDQVLTVMSQNETLLSKVSNTRHACCAACEGYTYPSSKLAIANRQAIFQSIVPDAI